MSSILKVNTIQGASNTATVIKTSGGTDALTIDTSGRVTQPVLPACFWQGGNEGNVSMTNGETFWATNDGQAAALTDGTGLSYIQGGITYTAATGSFTVPINGIYHIHGQAYHNEDGVNYRMGGNINGTQRFMGHAHQNMNRGTRTAVAAIKLNANDVITFTLVGGSDCSIYEGQNHTYGFIYLVG